MPSILHRAGQLAFQGALVIDGLTKAVVPKASDVSKIA